jgi:hypothetical protein
VKDFLYDLLKLLGDLSAIGNGTVPRRVGRRVYGKATGRIARRLFG